MSDKKESITHAAAHYLFAIHKLKEIKGYARLTDIAGELGLTKGAVSTTLTGLKNKGLVEEEPGSRFLVLSTQGHSEVHQILANRELCIILFRDILNVPETEAIRVSCQIEHLIDDSVSCKLFEFLSTLSEKESHQKKKKTLQDLKKFSSSLSEYKTHDEFVHHQESEIEK